MPKSDLKIVLLGGGTGSFTLLSEFKNSFDNLTALVNMVDNGGSSGALRDELGVLPPGDIRQCLVALSDSSELRDLFNYRFSQGSMEGHPVGNIFLSALEKSTGSFSEAVKAASRILRINGTVIPITSVDTHLVLKNADDSIIKGEFQISKINFNGEYRPKLYLEPEAIINPDAEQAIDEADLIVIAPGDLYASLVPNLLVKGVSEAIVRSKAKKIYVCNLVTKPNQTSKYDVDDFVDEIERFAGKDSIDYVFYNTDEPSPELLNKYIHEGEFLVKYNPSARSERHYKLIGLPLIAKQEVKIRDGDHLAHNRSFIRHDAKNLIVPITEIVNNNI